MELTLAKPDIALMGPARSGKDATASYLVSTYGYARVAFADPLKAMALRADPWLPDTPNSIGGRLSALVSLHGWEHVKDRHDEARRILQTLGQAQRELDEDYWLRLALEKVTFQRRHGNPVVITDCRYPNEYHELRTNGFQMVRLHREGASAGGAAADHSSETALSRYHADVDIYNDGSLDDLYRKIDWHAGG